MGKSHANGGCNDCNRETSNPLPLAVNFQVLMIGVNDFLLSSAWVRVGFPARGLLFCPR